MRHDPAGQVVEVGVRTRTISPAIRRALHHRDQGCRFPGCGVRFGQGHHIRHWAQGGPTTLSNLTMLCRRHHRAVHEEGYDVERQPDGALRFRRPDGRTLPDVPTPPRVPDDPVRALRARNEAAGLHLHAQTMTPGWLGARAWTWSGPSTSCTRWLSVSTKVDSQPVSRKNPASPWREARESSALAAVRDALLPKLISGEIRVKDAERIAAGVT
jgi:HNH endonuclease